MKSTSQLSIGEFTLSQQIFSRLKETQPCIELQFKYFRCFFWFFFSGMSRRLTLRRQHPFKLKSTNSNQPDSFLQHFLAHQHGSGGRRLLVAAADSAVPWWKPHLLAHPPAELGGGKLRHPVAHQTHAAPHRAGHLQDFPRALRQCNPEKAWQPGRQRSRPFFLLWLLFARVWTCCLPRLLHHCCRVCNQ